MKIQMCPQTVWKFEKISLICILIVRRYTKAKALYKGKIYGREQILMTL